MGRRPCFGRLRSGDPREGANPMIDYPTPKKHGEDIPDNDSAGEVA